MERRLVVWPGWLGGPDDAPRPEWDSPAGEWLAQAQVERLVAPEQASRTPEVAWFGLEPHLYTTVDGPLAVGAMGKDFPGPVGARDTLFALDWMTLDADGGSLAGLDGGAEAPRHAPAYPGSRARPLRPGLAPWFTGFGGAGPRRSGR